jgi:methylmalonyl-CoA/ethylmalonyl-CoA epimerase
MIGRLNHVAIATADLAKSCRLYRESLGARVLGDGNPKIGAHGKPVLFLHPKDFGGTLIELEQA